MSDAQKLQQLMIVCVVNAADDQWKEGASPADAGASRCSRPEQQVEPPESGKAFCYEADLHNADLKANGPLGVSIRVER
jgi:hypothetical protein